jgi:hypothetical protein
MATGATVPYGASFTAQLWAVAVPRACACSEITLGSWPPSRASQKPHLNMQPLPSTFGVAGALTLPGSHALY